MNRSEGQNIQLHRPVFELLAPAGSYEIFQAVLAAGADAVYLGGDRFGARAYAGNFSAEELLAAIDYAHLHGRRVYLTVNTLLKNPEIEGELFRYLLPLYERGLDAVLVQDIGAFSLIRQRFPRLPIHVSTQMTATSAESVRLFTELGADRVVLSRELSLAEIRDIHEQTGAQLEVFVHGALCYCYSGQCLFSSMLGGRSGNRGRCAQPCRLPYAVSDGNLEFADSYVLSLKDLCGIENLNELYAAGVYSLKIEGRMKQLSYAAGVVSYYRSYIDEFVRLLESGQNDGRAVCRMREQDRKAIYSLGNRCGFTDGYYYKQNGADMVTFTKPSYERADEALWNSIAETYRKPLKQSAKGKLLLREGERARYEVTCQNAECTVSGIQVQGAQKKPLRREDVAARMAKTGETPFVMEQIDIQMDGNVFLSNGALNQLRRDALEGMSREMLKGFRRDPENMVSDVKADGVPDEWNLAAEKGRQNDARSRLVCLTERRELVELLLKQKDITTVYLDAGAYPAGELWELLAEDVRKCRQAGKEVCFAMPRIFRRETALRYEQKLECLRGLSLDGVLIRNYEELGFAIQNLSGLLLIADHNLYTYNNRAVRALHALGVARDTVPLELNRKEIAHRDNRDSELVLYGYYPLMTSAQCIHGNTGGCDRRPGLSYLTDRRGSRFAVKNFCSDCYNVLYNSLPTMLFADVKEFRRSGISSFRLDFTVESAGEAERVLKLYRDFAAGVLEQYPKEWEGRYTGGHAHRGVE